MDQALVREARRLCQRYVDEVVLEFDLCPWAAPALRANRVEISVIADQIRATAEDGPSVAQRVTQVLDAMASDSRVELVLLVLPRFELGRLDLDVFQRMVRELHTPTAPSFLLAAFHPDARPDTSDPERMIPFLRRSPDPMLQAVRATVLDRIDPSRGSGTQFMDLATLLSGNVASTPAPEPLRRRIARTNLETIQRHGIATVEQALSDIIEDRNRTYAKLGLSDAE
jgi:hypothetical protein